jgi:hypothetical protein
MSKKEAVNPVEDSQRNADRHAQAPLQDRPVSSVDRKDAEDQPKTLRKTDADA